MQKLEIDHFAVSCEALTQGVEYVADFLGVSPEVQGSHPQMGTHNRLLSLGPSVYLEVIAIDTEAPPPDYPRWFDLDNFSGPPRLTNWICRTSNLQSALTDAPLNTGQPISFEREKYNWDIAVPKDGKLPFSGGFPALIQWRGAAHPAPDLPQTAFQFKSVNVMHPQALDLKRSLAKYTIPQNVQVTDRAKLEIQITVETPSGERTLR